MPAMEPRLLRPDNFTPPSRTPWGGTRILQHYKAQLGIAADQGIVGESWEVSVEPSFPSVFDDGTGLLKDAIASDPEAWLGKHVARRYRGQTPILVKLLDARQDLSVQVHPSDADPGLGPGESGKPESWLILDADDGAGIYLGFKEGVDRGQVVACLRSSGRLDDLLNFLPVSRGDVFLIPAGVVHCIGAGVTLVEPQHVQPEKRGVTYRYWDWNRRYDSMGRLSPHGRPRELHLHRSLRATDWEVGGGLALLESCHVAGALDHVDGLESRRVVDWPHFQVDTWCGTGRMSIHDRESMLALTCVDGSAVLETSAGCLGLSRGQSAVVPADSGSLVVDAWNLELVVCSQAAIRG